MATVLIVEDEKALREVLCQFLNEKHTVIEADNGADAFMLFEKFTPEIVLTDLSIAGINGYTLIGRLRSVSSGIKIVAISASLNALDEQIMVMRSGADLFLPKPFSIDLLI